MKDARNEILRQIIEMAVSCGKRLQSSQTGYLHHYHGTDEGIPSLTIPMAENALFALALLRSKSVENGLEAKTLLDKLLYFQHPQGNFPQYLHEFPECRDRFVAAHVCVPLFWIFKNFHQVLGNPLKTRLEEALVKAVKHSLSTLKDKQAPYYLTLKIAALALACGHLLHQNEFEQEGSRLLGELQSSEDPIAWHSPAQMGVMLSSLQMVFPSIEKSPWSHFWQFLENTWHRKGCAYIGPSIAEFQVEYEPQVTLYDLYLSYFTGQFSARCLKPQLIHLHGALIHANEGELKVSYSSAEGRIKDAKWQFLNLENFGYSYIEKGNFLNPSIEKGFHLFRFVAGTPQRVHTFVCQGGNDQKTECVSSSSDHFEILFYLNAPAPGEDREKNRDILFFFDVDDRTEIKIEGSRANTFALQEKIEIKFGSLLLTLKFSLEEGEGRFLGHLMRGNRPSQLKSKGDLNAYDWQIFLRTVQRHQPCKVKATITWRNNDTT